MCNLGLRNQTPKSISRKAGDVLLSKQQYTLVDTLRIRNISIQMNVEANKSSGNMEDMKDSHVFPQIEST